MNTMKTGRTGVDRWLLLVCVALLASGCINTKPDKPKAVAITQASSSLPEERLIDVSIGVFEPGPIKSEERTSMGITHGIRQSEARFIPVHLRNTLERSGYWGAVRVVPAKVDDGELNVSGEILVSDGEQLHLKVEATDATGLTWLSKVYKGVARPADHDRVEPGERDAFQDVYNAIANDLARFKQAQPMSSLQRLRQIAELRFAEDVAPAAFNGYLRKDKQGRYQIARLPAEDDPMLQRVLAVRERDQLLVDTINGQYDNYYRDLWAPYSNWRKFRAEELENLREVENDATLRKAIGIGAVAGAIALEIFGGANTIARTGTLRQTMVLGGIMAAKSGFEMDEERELHIESINELGESFQSDAETLVVEVDGETHRLTGSAEEQYAKWRVLLGKIYARETGLPAN